MEGDYNRRDCSREVEEAGEQCEGLNVSNAQCAYGGGGNRATSETARARAGRALKVMMRSVDFILMSVGDPWKGLRQSGAGEQFVHHRAGRFRGTLWGDVGGDRERTAPGL